MDKDLALATVMANITTYTIAELRTLHITAQHAISSAMMSGGRLSRPYRIGQKVQFEARGRLVVMEIQKVNPKSLGGIERKADGTTMKWRAHPSLVMPVTTGIAELAQALEPTAAEALTATITKARGEVKPSTSTDAW